MVSEQYLERRTHRNNITNSAEKLIGKEESDEFIAVDGSIEEPSLEFFHKTVKSIGVPSQYLVDYVDSATVIPLDEAIKVKKVSPCKFLLKFRNKGEIERKLNSGNFVKSMLTTKSNT